MNSSMAMATVVSAIRPGVRYPSNARYEISGRLVVNWEKKMMRFASRPCAVASRIMCSQTSNTSSDDRHQTSNTSSNDGHLRIMKLAREKFVEEVSIKLQDKDVSLAKALLLVAAEDEAFMAFNREKGALCFKNERGEAQLPFEAHIEADDLEDFCLARKNISGWLSELYVIPKEVEAELISRDICCYLVEVLDAVNFVLFKSRGFKRFPVLVDPKLSYIHTVLNSGYGSGKA